FINVDFDLTEKYEGLYVNVTDLSGKVLRSASLENIQKEQVTFSVRELPTGTYHVRIVTKDGSRTLPFIIQR
ncbi:MAG TPA: T9SS type A sorting domain-containing protein, partial [Saprospiraceae bacterium]|nr:T9SS type A sorting domain-containing protein [Saprospiraceae bacterium]